MIHVVIFFYLIALGTGFFTLGVSVHLAVVHRHRTIRLFIAWSLALLTAVFALLVRAYGLAVGPPERAVFGELSLALMSLGCLLYLAVSPFFFKALVGRPVSSAEKIVFIAFDLLLGAAAAAYFVLRQPFLLFALLIPSLFITLAYGVVLILVNLKNLGDPALRRALRVCCLVAALSLPLLALDAVYDRIPALAPLAPSGLLTLPAFFIALHLLCLFFAENRWNRPAFWAAGRITEYFLKKYGISEREAEVVALILAGDGSAAMGGKLFVSPKTIENHIYSIYQKTGVKNRVQLVNLIRTNY